MTHRVVCGASRMLLRNGFISVRRKMSTIRGCFSARRNVSAHFNVLSSVFALPLGYQQVRTYERRNRYPQATKAKILQFRLCKAYNNTGICHDGTCLHVHPGRRTNTNNVVKAITDSRDVNRNHDILKIVHESNGVVLATLPAHLMTMILAVIKGTKHDDTNPILLQHQSLVKRIFDAQLDHLDENILVYAAMNHDVQLAAVIFQTMTSAMNKVCHGSLLKQLCDQGFLEEAQAVYDCDNAKAKDHVSTTILIRGYCTHGQVQAAQAVFDRVIERSPDMYRALMKGYCEQGEVKRAHSLMQANITEISQDNRDVTLASTIVLKGYCFVGDMKEAQALFDLMPEHDNVSYNILLQGYCDIGDMKHAEDVFYRMPSADIIAYSVLMNGYCKHEQMHLAQEIFNVLKKKGLADLKIYTSIMKGYCDVGDWSEAENIHREMVQPDDVANGTLLQGLAEHTTMDRARKFFDSLNNPTTVLCNILLTWYNRHQLLDEATTLYEAMSTSSGYLDQCLPDTITYNIMLSAYYQSGNLQAALAVLESMPVKDALAQRTEVSINLKMQEQSTKSAQSMKVWWSK